MSSSKKKINIIITVNNRETYLPGLLNVIRQYKSIDPKIIVAYNGNKANFKCDFKIENLGLHDGDRSLILKSYDLLKDNGINRFIKLSVDSWLVNESPIYSIFEILESKKLPYAGNRWCNPNTLSSDIVFADINYGNIFEELKNIPTNGCMECAMWLAVNRIGVGYYTIPQREPVHPHNRHCVESLGWTMSHDINQNYLNAKKFGAKLASNL